MLQTKPLTAEQSVYPLPSRAPHAERANVSVPGPALNPSRIDASHLQRYCFTSHDEALEDLTAVLSAVRTADRSVVRHHTTGWARDLVVHAQVGDLRL